MRKLIALLLLCLTAGSAQAAVQVFACEPEWGSLAEALGGKQVRVTTATSAMQDPHHIQARPSLIARLRRADLAVCTGAQLEIGWLPVLLRRAANPKVQPGQPGYFEAAAQVQRKDVPQSVDRSLGDIHPQGNPHIQLDPRNIARVAAALAERLAQIDPAHAADYRARYRDFADRWGAAERRWAAQAAPLRGLPVVSQHSSWVYLNDWLGMRNVITMEDKPGIPPSGARMAAVAARLRAEPARAVLRAAYQDPRPAEWLARHAPVKVVVLPFTVGGAPGADDLFGLFDVTLKRLLEAAS